MPSTGGVRLPQIRPSFGACERIHPGAAALVFARVPIGVEGAAVFDRVAFCTDGIPDGHAGFVLHDDAEDAAENFEHAGDHAIEREIGAQGFLVEIVEGEALFFGLIADVPGLERRPAKFSSSWFSSRKRFSVFSRRSSRKDLGALACVGHAVVEHQIGEVGETQQLGFFAAELEDFRDERAVVVRVRRRRGD